MSDKELSDFQATVMLKLSLKAGEINVSEDPDYVRLAAAKSELHLFKQGFTATSAVISAALLYRCKYHQRLPWFTVISRIVGTCTLFTLAYWTCPPMRAYNDALIAISRSHKQELGALVQKHAEQTKEPA